MRYSLKTKKDFFISKLLKIYKVIYMILMYITASSLKLGLDFFILKIIRLISHQILGFD